jgi:hypothetical protein
VSRADRIPFMGDPYERYRLSKTSIAWLGALVAVNLLVVVYFQVRDEPEESIAAVEVAMVPGSELRLLNELSENERAALVRKAPDPAPRDLPRQLIEEPAKVCRSWGPFADAATLDAVLDQVAESGEVLEVRSQEIQSTPDYLVRLDSDNNLDNTRRLLKELESQSIDAYVIAGGEFINSVSTGVFSSEVRANRQMRRLIDLGYAPRLEALERVQTVHHLIALVPEPFEVAAHESADCPVIAQAQQFL